jgi:uncharacterized LabA/DUF88 family protein
MKTYAFIDASNLFYGGEKSLGWKIDYQKLIEYLKEKYGVSQTFYFGGVEIHNFKYSYLESETVSLDSLEEYLKALIKNTGDKLNEAELLLIGRHLQRVRFYQHLESFGYKLFLKPVKLYEQEDGFTKRKANCDVDMAFHMMKEKDNFDKSIVLSGDGDFLPVLKYLKLNGKDITVFSRSERTAKEIKQFAESNFRDFQYLRERLKMR